MDKRRESLFLSVPEFFFFEEDFKKNGRDLANKKLVLDMSGMNPSEIMKCSPILTREQEFLLFRKFNYFKYRIVSAVAQRNWRRVMNDRKEVRKRVDRMDPKKLELAESFVRSANETRDIIMKSNMRLAVKPVSRYEKSMREEMMSNACIHIMKAIEKFDYKRGLKFSTYCVNAIKNNLFRDFSLEQNKRGKYWLSLEPERHEFKRKDRFKAYDEEFIAKAIGALEPRQKLVIKKFFGLGSEKMLLREIAVDLGISRQSVENIRNKALKIMSGVEYDPI